MVTAPCTFAMGRCGVECPDCTQTLATHSGFVMPVAQSPAAPSLSLALSVSLFPLFLAAAHTAALAMASFAAASAFSPCAATPIGPSRLTTPSGAVTHGGDGGVLLSRVPTSR